MLPQFQATKIQNFYSDFDILIKRIKYIKIEQSYGQEAMHFYSNYSKRYKFEQILSKKTNSTIVLANDTRLNRYVTIRFFKNIKNSTAIKKMILDAVNFSKIFPNCIDIYDADFKRVPHVILDFMVMGSLRKKLRNNKNGILFTEVTQILKEIGTALVRSKAHHCDLKPSNILLSKENIPYLNPINKKNRFDREKLISDYKEFDFNDNIVDSSRMEDLQYFAPEIFDKSYKGLSANIGFEKIDQYMLGLLGYELLTGTLPKVYQSIDDLIKPISKQRFRERLRIMEDCIDIRFSEILAKMTDPEPKKRYKTLEDAISEIRKSMVQQQDLEIVRESYIRCLKHKVSDKTFFEVFYKEFTKDKGIKELFEKFHISASDDNAMRRQYNHLQGAIFGLIEYANQVLNNKPMQEINILKYVAERHSFGDDTKEIKDYFIGVRPKYFNAFLETLLQVVCGNNTSEPFDIACKKSKTEKEKIEQAWRKIIQPGIEYMKDQL